MNFRKLPKSFYLVLLIIFLFGCNKDEIDFDPQEVILNIKVFNLEQYNDMFVIVENGGRSTTMQLVPGKNEVKRGELFAEDLINFHLVNFHFGLWDIVSYYKIEIGKTIELDRNNGSTTTPEMVDICFSDIPEFDVVSRSAHFQSHSHTDNTFDVQCAKFGGNTFPVGGKFYVCLQNGSDAGYVLETIPNEEEHTISLANLNTDMTKYSIPKNSLDEKTGISVSASGSNGSIEIFDLPWTESGLFGGDNIEIFVPNGLLEMQKIGTSFRVYKDDNSYLSYYASDKVTTSYELFETGLEKNHISGSLPTINIAKVNFDYLTIGLRAGSGSWTIYTPDGKDLSIPDFPIEDFKNTEYAKLVENSDPLEFDYESLLSESTGFTVTASKDSRLKNYNDAIDSKLGIRSFSADVYQVFHETK